MKYYKNKIKNGPTVINISGLQTKAVTIAVYVRGGFRFDPSSKPGLSHFTEHIIFNSSNSTRINKLVEAVESAGGWRSAFTWIEHQEHIIHLPEYGFENGIRLAIESILNTEINQAEIDKEKGVIREEIIKNKSDPSKAIWDLVWLPLFFNGTHINRPYSGTIKDIADINLEDIKYFHSHFFTQEDLCVFVAGNVKDSQVLDLINKYIPHKSKLEKKPMKVLLPEFKKKILVIQDNSYYQTSLVFGVKTVPFNSNEKFIFDIILDMLGGYSSATLIRKLRDEGGLIYSWKTYQDNLSEIGYMMFNVSVEHKNVNKVASIILDEFNRIALGNFDDKEINIAKNHLIGNMLANIQTGLDYIYSYSLQELLNSESVLTLNEKVKMYRNIKPEKLREVASRCFTKEKILVGAIGQTSEESLSGVL